MSPSGNTTTSALADSLPTMISAARIKREKEGRASQLVDRETLEIGTGLSWHEITLEQLTAQAITESTELDNPQQVSDTKFSITPTVIGIQTLFTDRVAERISKKAFAKTGELAMNAMIRKRDQDVIAVFDGATVSLCGAGNTLTSGHISAAKSEITSNPTEPNTTSPVVACLHGRQIKDIADEVRSGLGTYPVPEGLTANVWREGFSGMVDGVGIFEDGNISVDSNSDAKGAVFAREAIVLVQGETLKKEERREPHIGGGATSIFLYDEYGLGERSAGNWLKELFSDATASTA